MGVLQIFTPLSISINQLIIVALMTSQLENSWAMHGPHHPRSSVKRDPHIDQHLSYGKRHIEEDLNKISLPDQKTIEEMSEDEKNYLYFKVHDLDGNGKLDGLEIYYSATHHSDLPHEESQQYAPLKTNFEDSIEERDNNFNHIIDILDNFLDVADLNQDGYLNYPEYAAAIKLGSAMAEAQESAI